MSWVVVELVHHPHLGLTGNSPVKMPILPLVVNEFRQIPAEHQSNSVGSHVQGWNGRGIDAWANVRRCQIYTPLVMGSYSWSSA